jgi:hypothetical protein
MQVLADEDWKAFVASVDTALRRTGSGEAEAYKALWSHSEDVLIFGAFGGFAKGWAEVGPRLDWAISQMGGGEGSIERIVEYVGADVAYTVHCNRGNLPLRVTQVYRRENGSWRIVLRHADPLMETVSMADTIAWLAKR